MCEFKVSLNTICRVLRVHFNPDDKIIERIPCKEVLFLLKSPIRKNDKYILMLDLCRFERKDGVLEAK